MDMFWMPQSGRPVRPASDHVRRPQRCELSHICQLRDLRYCSGANVATSLTCERQLNTCLCKQRQPGTQLVGSVLRIATNGAVMAGLCLAAPLARAHCQMGLVAELSVVNDNGAPVTHAEVDGKSIAVLIDTGGTQTVLMRPAAERLGLHRTTGLNETMYGLGGALHTEATLIPELKLAQFKIKNLRVPVIESSAGFDILLSEDFLSTSALEFDLRHHEVRMLMPKGCQTNELPYWAKSYSLATLVASPKDTGRVEVDVLLNGRTVRAQIDSGSPSSVVSKEVAEHLGVSYVGAGPEIHGLGDKLLEDRIGRFKTFTIGDETISNVQVDIAPLGEHLTAQRIGSRIPVELAGAPEMLLGADFLRAHRLLISNSTRQMVFTYEGGPIFQVTMPVQAIAAPAIGAVQSDAPSSEVDTSNQSATNP
jgi:clan AA aspartic protease (TIGR02281 family)